MNDAAEMPAIRGGHAKDNLASLSLLGPHLTGQIRAAMAQDALEAIESASRVDWLPVSVDVKLTETVAQIVGPEGCRRWSREALRESLHTPILSPVVQGGVRVFGLSPAGLFRLVPRGIKAIFRAVGSVDVRRSSDKEVMLVWGDLPEVMARSQLYPEGCAGAFEALFEFVDTWGEVLVELSDPSERRFVFRCRWD